MRLGWTVKGFDWLDRIKTVLGWLGYSGFLSMIGGAVWSWLIGKVIWWPAFAALGLFVFVILKIAIVHYEAKRHALERDKTLEAFAPAFVASVEMVLEKRQQAPSLQAATAPEAPIQRSRVERMGTPVALLETPPFVPLADVMAEAYDRTKDGVLGAFAERFGRDEDGVLNWYAYFSFKLLPMYGRRPPAKSFELVDPSKINRFNFADGAKTLKAKHGQNLEELSVKREDVEPFLARIVEIEEQYSFQAGFEEETKSIQSPSAPKPEKPTYVDSKTRRYAGDLQHLGEVIRHPRFVNFQPNSQEEYNYRNILDSTHVIWTKSEALQLRRQFRDVVNAISTASMEHDDRRRIGAITVMDDVISQLVKILLGTDGS